MKQAILAAFAALLCASAVGQNNFKVIHSFAGFPNDGLHPIGDVVFDSAGNMYGTAPGGGSNSCDGDNGCGVVYELSPQTGGEWKETILYNFCANNNGVACLDGAFPGAGMAMDEKGNLYGVGLGGSGFPGNGGGGVLFELSPPSQPGGTWSETVLYNFCSDMQNGQCLDGLAPTSQPVFDSLGNLYGTTAGGGTGHLSLGGGTAYELSPGASGWTEKILYNFCSEGTGDDCPDGEIPTGGVTFDKFGNLFGTTDYSGNANLAIGGTLYELSPSDATWSYTRLLSVPPKSGFSDAQAPVAFDPGGNLYGAIGNPHGAVFRVDRKTHAVRLFIFNGNDGSGPGGVFVDPKTNALYGTTTGGFGPGNIFEIGADGQETVLYDFCTLPGCADGDIPGATLVPDNSGNLYGTTEFGGEYNSGVVFEITP